MTSFFSVNIKISLPNVKHPEGLSLILTAETSKRHFFSNYFVITILEVYVSDPAVSL